MSPEAICELLVQEAQPTNPRLSVVGRPKASPLWPNAEWQLSLVQDLQTSLEPLALLEAFSVSII